MCSLVFQKSIRWPSKEISPIYGRTYLFGSDQLKHETTTYLWNVVGENCQSAVRKETFRWKLCFQSWCFGVAKGDQVPPGPLKNRDLSTVGLDFLESSSWNLEPRHIYGMSRVRAASRQFARKPSDGNWFANREVSGSRNVTKSLRCPANGPPFYFAIRSP